MLVRHASQYQRCFYYAWRSIRRGFSVRGLAALGPYQVLLPTSLPFEEICVVRSIRASSKSSTSPWVSTSPGPSPLVKNTLLDLTDSLILFCGGGDPGWGNPVGAPCCPQEMWEVHTGTRRPFCPYLYELAQARKSNGFHCNSKITETHIHKVRVRKWQV